MQRRSRTRIRRQVGEERSSHPFTAPAPAPADHPLHTLQRQVGNRATGMLIHRLTTLTDDMSPTGVHYAIRNPRNDPEQAVGPHSWVRKDAYVSNWDHPVKPKGQGTGWGFSTAHWLSKASKWVIHVHRSEAGTISDKHAANVQDSSLEGKGASKETLTSTQLGRIGIPATETPSRYVEKRWLQLGKKE